MYSDVAFQMPEISSEDQVINQVTSIPKGNHIPQLNQKVATNKLKGNHITGTPYRHPNHKNKHHN